MNSDEARAFAAMRRTEVRGTNEEPFRFGTAVLTPELPLRHDSNFLYADRLTARRDGRGAGRRNRPHPRRRGLRAPRHHLPGRRRSAARRRASARSAGASTATS